MTPVVNVARAEGRGMQWQRGAYSIDTDRERLDMERIITWLRGTYWAGGRAPEVIRRSWDGSALAFGLYEGAQQIGCARVVSDRVTVAYLADVFLLPDYRGQGLGTWLMQTIIGHPDLATVGWLLHTRDAHALYHRVGFVERGERLMERPRAISPN
jgi:GNAT superfamily N-acetyltransferase